MPPKIRVFIYPSFGSEDKGDGGIRRVVEAQRKYLPKQQGVDLVDDPGDADVIACHISIPEEFLKRFPDKPFVAHCHGLYWSEYQWEEWAYKANRDVLRACAVSDVVTAPSEWVAQAVRRHTMRDVRVVPHGIDLREWQPAPEHRGYVLWNKTRPDPVCDPRAAMLLAEAMPDIPFLVTFASTFDSSAVPPTNVTVSGRLNYESAKQIVRHAGVYLATTRETFGIGTLEAMAAGVPVVGYRFGAQPEILNHGVDSWLVEPGDIEGLAEGVRWALENREAVGTAARERAREFPWTVGMKIYKEIYAEVIDRYEAREKAPRTTVLVTAWDLERYLPEALASVEAQTDPDWECIIVDDASPDRCGEIADEWAAKDSRFKVVHNPENLHVSGARNAGIEVSTGRYILPLDADDRLAPLAIKVLADALDSDRSLSVTYGGVHFTEEDGTPSLYGPQYEPGQSGWPMPFEARSQLSGANLLPYSSMYRREAWVQTGGYRRRLKMAEDADFWTRLTSYGFRIQRVTEAPMLYYRNHDDSLSHRESARRWEYLRWYPWARTASPSTPSMVTGPKGVSLLDPRVSVVIPVGPGHEQLAVDAVDSVSAQTYPYWEVIVVNDSGNVLPTMPPFVRLLQCHARDTGAARNMGIKAALGTLFLPLDADDFLQPEALEHLVAAYEETQTIIYPDFFEDPRQEGNFKPYTLPNFDCNTLLTKGCVHSIVALTPVEVWRTVGGYKESKNWEDWDFQLRCASHGICSTRLPEPLFTYRKWTGTRREYDKPEFERRKADILEDWGEYFSGGKTLAGCGCKGASVTPKAPPARARQEPGAPDAVLIEYVGQKQGVTRYRGRSGAVYPFARGSGPRYVAFQDVDWFTARPDFAIAENSNGAVSNTPVLVA